MIGVDEGEVLGDLGFHFDHKGLALHDVQMCGGEAVEKVGEIHAVGLFFEVNAMEINGFESYMVQVMIQEPRMLDLVDQGLGGIGDGEAKPVIKFRMFFVHDVQELPCKNPGAGAQFHPIGVLDGLAFEVRVHHFCDSTHQKPAGAVRNRDIVRKKHGEALFPTGDAELRFEGLMAVDWRMYGNHISVS